jgi:putative membrane protein
MSRDTGPELDPRVLLAADRTLLAWIRTALGLIAFGFLLSRLATVGEGIPGTTIDPATSALVGTLMLACGLTLNLAAAGWYLRFVRQYRRGEWLPSSHVWLPTALAIVVSALAAALVWLVAWPT